MIITIRSIENKDKDKYLEMVTKFYNSDAVLHSVPYKNFENTFNEVIKSNTYAECFMIMYNLEIVGYTLISKTYSQEVGGKVLLIEEIYIESKFRNKGIGKKIFEFLENRYEGYKRFRLEVEKSNTNVITLYRKIGFDILEYVQMIKDK